MKSGFDDFVCAVSVCSFRFSFVVISAVAVLSLFFFLLS